MIAIVRFDCGDDKNALSRQVMRNLMLAARSFEEDTEVSAIILTGQSRVFTLGFDLRRGAAGSRVGRAPPAPSAGAAALPRLGSARADDLVRRRRRGVGSVARSARAGVEARFYVPEIERGMNMSWQSVPRLVALIGPARTKRLTVMAERIDAERAREWGLIDEATPAGGAFDKAMEMSERVAALPPVQVRMCKEEVNAATTALHRAVSIMDRDQYLLAAQSEDHHEGVRAFLEKRPPSYTGR